MYQIKKTHSLKRKETGRNKKKKRTNIYNECISNFYSIFENDFSKIGSYIYDLWFNKIMGSKYDDEQVLPIKVGKYTNVKGLKLDAKSISSIRSFRDEIGLRMGFNDARASLVETYRFILEDFAQQYDAQKKLDEVKLEWLMNKES